MTTESSTRYLGILKLRKGISSALWIALGLVPIALAIDIFQYFVLVDIQNQNFATVEEMRLRAEASDRNQIIIAAIQVLVWLAVAFLWAFWTFKSNKLVRSLGAKDMKYSPGWSVGWYFIPFLNLIKPYLALKEIYLATLNPHRFNVDADVEDQPESLNILKLWWLSSIAERIFGVYLKRISSGSDTMEQLFYLNKLLITSDLISLTTTLIWIWLLREFSQRQDETYKGIVSQAAIGEEPQTTSV